MDGHYHAKLEIGTKFVNWFFMFRTHRPQQFAQSELIMVFHIQFKLHIWDHDRGGSFFQNNGTYPPNWTASYPKQCYLSTKLNSIIYKWSVNLDINSSDNIKSHNILSQHSKIKWRKKSVHIDEVHSTCPK
jgi:hypothetical protein